MTGRETDGEDRTGRTRTQQGLPGHKKHDRQRGKERHREGTSSPTGHSFISALAGNVHQCIHYFTKLSMNYVLFMYRGNSTVGGLPSNNRCHVSSSFTWTFICLWKKIPPPLPALCQEVKTIYTQVPISWCHIRQFKKMVLSMADLCTICDDDRSFLLKFNAVYKKYNIYATFESQNMYCMLKIRKHTRVISMVKRSVSIMLSSQIYLESGILS